MPNETVVTETVVQEAMLVIETPPVEAPVIVEEPVVVDTPPADTNAGGLVWKSATGKKYHSINDGGNMNPNKAVQITLSEARH